MYSLIVLGQVPGTDLRLTFDMILALIIFGFITYRYRRFIPKNKKVSASYHAYKKRFGMLIVRHWHNIFSPKPKLLK